MENIGEFIINHWILSTLFVVLLWLVFSDTLNRKLSGLQLIEVEEAVRLNNQSKALFVDVRDKSAFEKAHINDAVHLPQATIKEEDKPLKATDKPLILVCDSGQSSRLAAKQLKSKGYSDVYVLKGGLNAWREAKLPLFS